MTPRMKAFLSVAARCTPGKGMMVDGSWSRIASKAVRDGFGWMIEAPFKMFIIDERGRKALAKENKP